MKDDIFVESCGNVFEDLGLDDAKEMQAKSKLANTVLKIIKHKKMTLTAAAKLLHTHQTQISRLNTGTGIKSLSFDILMKWLTILEYNITVSIEKNETSKYHIGQIQVAI